MKILLNSKFYIAGFDRVTIQQLKALLKVVRFHSKLWVYLYIKENIKKVVLAL